MTRTVVSPRAARDIEESAEYYNSEQSGLGLRFAQALEAAYLSIEAVPKGGSTRYLHLLPDEKQLRMYIVKSFPFLVFYVEHENQIRIERVLHAHRDLPSALSENSH